MQLAGEDLDLAPLARRQLALGHVRAGPGVLGLASHRLDLGARALDLDLLPLEPGEEGLGLLLLVVAAAAGVGHDTRRQAEALGHLEGEAAAGRAHRQAVRGLVGVGPVAEGGAGDAGRRLGVRLHEAVVRRRDDRRARAAEVLDDRDAEGAAFGRVGAGADLVEEHERGPREGARHLDDGGEVRRERREVLGDRLLVADVGEHASEDREAAAGAGGNVEAALGHEREEADGLRARPSCRPCSGR